MKTFMIAFFLVVFVVVVSRADDEDSGDDADSASSSESGDSSDRGDNDDDDYVPPDTGAEHDHLVLTFDASPHPVHTPKLLELLADRDITASFCVTNEQAVKHSELVARIISAGHELCDSDGVDDAQRVRLRGDQHATVAALPRVIRDVQAAGYTL